MLLAMSVDTAKKRINQRMFKKGSVPFGIVKERNVRSTFKRVWTERFQTTKAPKRV